MKIRSIPAFTLIALVLSIAFTARGESSWEAVAVKGLATMNTGDGKSFAEVAHRDHKNQLKNFLLARMRASPNTADTRNTLKDHGVGSLAELEAVPLDRLIAVTIRSMHMAVPNPIRSALAEAQFSPTRSEPQGDMYRVFIDMTFTLNGKTGTRGFVILTRQEDGAWKYCGEEPKKQ